MRILLPVMTIGFSTTPIYHTEVNPQFYSVTYLLYPNNTHIHPSLPIRNDIKYSFFQKQTLCSLMILLKQINFLFSEIASAYRPLLSTYFHPLILMVFIVLPLVSFSLLQSKKYCYNNS